MCATTAPIRARTPAPCWCAAAAPVTSATSAPFCRTRSSTRCIFSTPTAWWAAAKRNCSRPTTLDPEPLRVPRQGLRKAHPRCRRPRAGGTGRGRRGLARAARRTTARGHRGRRLSRPFSRPQHAAGAGVRPRMPAPDANSARRDRRMRHGCRGNRPARTPKTSQPGRPRMSESHPDTPAAAKTRGTSAVARHTAITCCRAATERFQRNVAALEPEQRAEAERQARQTLALENWCCRPRGAGRADPGRTGARRLAGGRRPLRQRRRVRRGSRPQRSRRRRS